MTSFIIFLMAILFFFTAIKECIKSDIHVKLLFVVLEKIFKKNKLTQRIKKKLIHVKKVSKIQ